MPLNVQGGKKKPLKAAKKGVVEMTEEDKAFKKEMAEKKK
ncbi:Translation machinery associated TMA7, putative [Plasmodium malariae]|nr:Translation machinery associated TMA7, putative [Plasmodium malariae]